MGATRRPAVRLWWLFAVAGVAVLVIHTAAQRHGPPDSYEELKAMAEASLLVPGSEVIDDGGGDGYRTPTGRVSATAWQVVGVNANRTAIESFFATELAATGWVDGAPGTSSGIRTTDELTARAWSKDCVVFRLGIRDPESRRADPAHFARYESVYDARVTTDRRCA